MPSVAGGSGPGAGAGGNDWNTQAASGSRVAYAHAFLQALGAPDSNGNVALLLSIMQNEGTSARNNPMASTWPAPGASDFNSVHVRNYADVPSAIAAQVTQWRQVFPNIVGALMSDNAQSVLGDPEWNSYSGNASGAYQRRLAQNYATFSGDPSAAQGVFNTTGTGTGATGSGSAGTGQGGIDATYKQYAFLVDDPQVGGYLRDLAGGHISDATFLAEVQGSAWWKQHSGSARAWQQLQSSDPSSYQQQVGEYARQVVETASQLGVGLDIGTIDKLANQWGMNSWTPQDVTNAILGYSSSARATGGLAFGQNQIRQSAAAYGINLSDQQAYQYELQVAKNQQTTDSLNGIFAGEAEKMFPHLSDQLQQGFTLQQLAQPYISAAASTLEIDPNTVDLSNPKWSRALAFHDGSQVRQMTQYEWQQTLMQDPTYGYDHTQGAQAAQAALGRSLIGTMTGVQP